MPKDTRLEKIAVGDFRKRNKTLKLVKHWQKRLWKEQEAKSE